MRISLLALLILSGTVLPMQAQSSSPDSTTEPEVRRALPADAPDASPLPLSAPTTSTAPTPIPVMKAIPVNPPTAATPSPSPRIQDSEAQLPTPSFRSRWEHPFRPLDGSRPRRTRRYTVAGGRGLLQPQATPISSSRIREVSHHEFQGNTRTGNRPLSSGGIPTTDGKQHGCRSLLSATDQ